jgi:hypothetical protein
LGSGLLLEQKHLCPARTDRFTYITLFRAAASWWLGVAFNELVFFGRDLTMNNDPRSGQEATPPQVSLVACKLLDDMHVPCDIFPPTSA